MTTILSKTILLAVMIGVKSIYVATAFVPPTKPTEPRFFVTSESYSSSSLKQSSTFLKVATSNQEEKQSTTTSSSDKQNTYKKKRTNLQTTIGDLKKKMLENPAAFSNPITKVNKKKKRTRRRVDNPQQKYLYAAQRKSLSSGKLTDGNKTTVEEDAPTLTGNIAVVEARRMGLTKPANQYCDPLVDDVEPEIMGKIRVGEEEKGSGTFAYLINKPQGWCILGGRTSSTGTNRPSESNDGTMSAVLPKQGSTSNKSKMNRVKIINSQGREEILEFDEADVLALLTPKERADILAKGSSVFETSGPIWNDMETMTTEERAEARIEEEDDDYDPNDIPDIDESEIESLLSPQELMEYNEEKGKRGNFKQSSSQEYLRITEDSLDPSALENLKRIKTRLEQKRDKAASMTSQRPSIVSWLKEKKAAEGAPVRGGKFWAALAGASEVDDSGLVLLAPKENAKNIFVDFTEYIMIVGNGNNLNPKAKDNASIPKECINLELISRLKRNREGDIAQTVRLVVSDHPSTCFSTISHVQNQMEDGVRGDPDANPFDRRAPRRLIHCKTIAASSLIFDETVNANSELPDDISILADRLNNHKFRQGSFLGRQSLQMNPLTNAYREINGAADGFPGWTVDRYGDWLFVQHDEKELRGPLPSIHDGYTKGVYMLPSTPNRGTMGSKENIRPYLLEGKPAPHTVEIMENGIKYLASLDSDLSTGIFLDQRPHRAWLLRNCNSEVHVLNCFAHCGAFSVAAASAGASTVSLDLNKKWLNRIQPQLEANGIEFNERHDCIFGDCFEWLEKLGKRGEKFDIVILDPPSSSVGKKKRRWSVKNDMDELVHLAAPLVKKGGFLWTTTNSASISPLKFANLCAKGIENAGIRTASLDRIQPMAVDFPSIGPQSVKNLVWKIL